MAKGEYYGTKENGKGNGIRKGIGLSAAFISAAFSYWSTYGFFVFGPT